MKRGQAIGLIPKIVIAALIIVLLAYMLGYTFTGAKPNLTLQSKLQQQITACKLTAAQGFSDTDKDGMADYCDPCPTGKETLNKDADILPPPCDKDDKLAAKSAEEACCGKEITGTTPEAKHAECLRLVGNEQYFQCDSTIA